MNWVSELKTHTVWIFFLTNSTIYLIWDKTFHSLIVNSVCKVMETHHSGLFVGIHLLPCGITLFLVLGGLILRSNLASTQPPLTCCTLCVFSPHTSTSFCVLWVGLGPQNQSVAHGQAKGSQHVIFSGHRDWLRNRHVSLSEPMRCNGILLGFLE